MKRTDRHSESRRAFIKTAAYGTAGLSLMELGAMAADDPYRPFLVGPQSYTFRQSKQDKVLELTKQLGLQYIEGYNAHFPQTEDKDAIQKMLDALKAADIKLIAYGVVGFGGNAAGNRKLFEFAKAMGIETLTANPTTDSLNQLSDLVDEFKINIAIHNHGPGALFDKIDSVLKAMEGRSERLGACVDTGHFMRSNEDALKAIKAFGSRIYGVHIKDLDKDKKFAELGKGDLDLEGCLEALIIQKSKGCFAIEYEEHPDNPVPYVEQYLTALRDTLKKLYSTKKLP